jgi:hypothetical protein
MPHGNQPVTSPSNNVVQVTVTPSPIVRVADLGNHPSPSTLHVLAISPSTPMVTAVQAPVSLEKSSTPAQTGTSHPYPLTLPQAWQPSCPPNFSVTVVNGAIGSEWPWYLWQTPVLQHHPSNFTSPMAGICNIPMQTSPVFALAGPETLAMEFLFPPFAVPFWNYNFAPFSPILSGATAPLPSNPHPRLLHTCLLIHSYQTQTQ